MIEYVFTDGYTGQPDSILEQQVKRMLVPKYYNDDYMYTEYFSNEIVCVMVRAIMKERNIPCDKVRFVYSSKIYFVDRFVKLDGKEDVIINVKPDYRLENYPDGFCSRYEKYLDVLF